MRRAWGVVVVALVLAISGCSDGVIHIKDAVSVTNLPACLTGPTKIAGTTYWMVPDAEGWETTHEDPFGGTPRPQASAEWDSDLDEMGVLYRFEDGSALFISANGNRIWFDQSEREYDGYC